VNGTWPPFDMDTDPLKASPAADAVIGATPQVPTPVMVRACVVPAVTVVAVIAGEQVNPPHVMIMLLATALEVPVFMIVTVPVGPAASVPCTKAALTSETRAVLVNDPKRPKTNPAMAMAAMRVMAMRMTVAKTGLIAFLRLALLICIVCYLLTRRFLRMESVRRSRVQCCLRMIRRKLRLHTYREQ